MPDIKEVIKNAIFSFPIVTNAVTSSNIDQIGYDQDSRCLEVIFKGGSRYRYKDVPPNIFAGLMESPSKGAFLAKAIARRYETFKYENSACE